MRFSLPMGGYFQIGLSINGGTQNGWFTMENPKINDDFLGYLNFRKPSNHPFS